ncbi:regulatory iron-sulfur-containing complex subunit RicT [Streptococcus phocae]|uniref:Signal peptidase II n=1 Tax=Streptococcus phocae TaxID=119224 RepID=A0A0P6S6U5_9STRE|nr:regulatory iron-sulfur-containing complex subunit RicT [Streptococcus phocae]KPJ21960.1 signal peptidase II [Streptococcus phocae]
MIKTIGIKYSDTDPVKYVQTDRPYPKGTSLVIKDSKGSRLAFVSQPEKDFEAEELPSELPTVLRLANTMDIKAHDQNAQFAEQSKAVVTGLIAKNKLPMKLIDTVFSLERSYVLITFSAEDRVDFRQLLRDLAGYFKTRIELRQLNSREEAQIYGGLGPCGRPLCCSSFLGEFPTVSIKMVKHQGLSLHSGKTTGCCGRLLCCLQYEESFYQESKKKFPDYGSIVETRDGLAVVTAIDIFNETIKVHFKDQMSPVTYALEEVKVGE